MNGVATLMASLAQLCILLEENVQYSLPLRFMESLHWGTQARLQSLIKGQH